MEGKVTGELARQAKTSSRFSCVSNDSDSSTAQVFRWPLIQAAYKTARRGLPDMNIFCGTVATPSRYLQPAIPALKESSKNETPTEFGHLATISGSRLTAAIDKPAQGFFQSSLAEWIAPQPCLPVVLKDSWIARTSTASPL